MEFFIHAECPKCDGDVYDRGMNFAEHKGLPVFSLDQFSQYSMTCENTVYRSHASQEASKETISEEEYQEFIKNLGENDSDDYIPEYCGYSFGTGDIEIVGEDEY